MKINEITKIQPSKTVIPALAKKLVQGHKEGYESAVEISTKLDFISKVCIAAKEDIKENVISEIREGSSSINGYELEIRDTGKFDYSNCNDPVLEELDKEMDKLKKKIVVRQKFLKSLPYEGMPYVNPDTGEELILRAPVKVGNETAFFTLQK